MGNVTATGRRGFQSIAPSALAIWSTWPAIGLLVLRAARLGPRSERAGSWLLLITR